MYLCEIVVGHGLQLEISNDTFNQPYSLQFPGIETEMSLIAVYTFSIV